MAEPLPRRRKGPLRADQIRVGDPVELSDGHMVYCFPTGGQGANKTKLGVLAILTDAAARDSGVDAGFAPHPEMLRAPDLAVGNVPDEPGWIEGVPSLAVEFAGTGQDEADLASKIEELLREGTKLIWVVRLVGPPRVEVHEPGRPMRTAGLDDELTAPGILSKPVPVRALFDPETAFEVGLRNLLAAHGYDSLEAVKAEGKVEGKAEGKTEGTARSVLSVLAERGLAATDDERSRILSCQDPEVLERWLRRSLRVASTSELFG